MPEASVDKNRDAVTDKDNVGAGSRIGERPVIDPEAKTSAMKDRAQVAFRCRVASSDAFHTG